MRGLSQLTPLPLSSKRGVTNFRKPADRFSRSPALPISRFYIAIQGIRPKSSNFNTSRPSAAKYPRREATARVILVASLAQK